MSARWGTRGCRKGYAWKFGEEPTQGFGRIREKRCGKEAKENSDLGKGKKSGLVIGL